VLVKFIHSSDLQIGKAFGNFDADVAVALQDARQLAVRALGEAAIKTGATAVLISGDIYEKQHMAQHSLVKAIENMRAYKSVQWHLMPGNHDRYQENGLWDRLYKMPLPANVTVHIRAGAVNIGNADGTPAFLLPAPLRFISNVDDLTAYMDNEPTPEGAIRIGMGHGSIRGFGSEGEANNFVDPNRSERAGLSYLAMGDWHRQIKVNDRCWYSGTPEPDQFKLPPNAVSSLCNGGTALLVELLSPRALPAVTSIPTGHYTWYIVEKTLTDDTQVDQLEAELRALNSDLSKIVVDLRIDGALSLSGRKKFEEQILQNVGAAMRALRFDETKLVLNPTEHDLDEIDHSGFIRVAAERLKAMAADANKPDRAALASLALKRLYLEHLRLGVKS